MTDDVSDDDDHEATRRLYASVIIQALIDATSEPKTSSGKVHKRQAAAWLTAEFCTTAQDFEDVCFAANMDPHRVQRFAKEYEGPPLTLHVLSRMRDSFLTGDIS